MTREHRVTRVIHGIAIAAVAMCACGAGPARKPRPGEPFRTGNVKTVTLTKVNGCIRYSDLALHARKGDVVYWVNDTGEQVTIRFTGDSPFKKHHPLVLEDGDIGGGVIDQDPGQGVAKHHAYKTLPAPCIAPVPGPDVIVDGGDVGPPPRKR